MRHDAEMTTRTWLLVSAALFVAAALMSAVGAAGWEFVLVLAIAGLIVAGGIALVRAVRPAR